MKPRFQSLRWRSILWQAPLLAAVLATLAVLSYQIHLNDRMDRIDRELMDFDRAFIGDLFRGSRSDSPDAPPSAPPSIGEILRRVGSLGASGENSLSPRFSPLFTGSGDSPFICIWKTDGTPLFLSANTPASFHRLVPAAGREREEFTSGAFRLHRHRNPADLEILIGKDISAEISSIRRFALLLSASAGGLWLSSLAIGWWLAARALRPIDAIASTARRIAQGDLRERIVRDHSDNELDRLAAVLNSTFDQLATSIEQQKRFTADASHELRTPLTIILSESQRALRRDRSPADYRLILDNVLAAATRMKGLVESMLTLAHQDSAQHLPFQPLRLDTLAASAVGLLEPLALQHRSRITTRLEPAAILGDESSLAMVLQNLLGNALSHTPPGTPVEISTTSASGSATLEVIDHGPGIDPAHLPFLFDRFYRADHSRTAREGHTGLGLAIVQRIVRNHHGRIEVASAPGLTRFTVVFPATAISP